MGAMIAMLKRMRVGVGARIYLAIGAIVALTIAASIVASLSFGRVEQTVRSLVDEHYPVVELSRELALVAAATVATAPKLAEVAVDGEREAIVKRLGEGEARMRAIVDDLHQRKAVDRARVMALLDELAANVQQMNNAARARISIESQKTDVAERMSRARVVFNQVLANSVDEAQFGLVFGLQDAAKIADAEKLQQTLKTLGERELVAYGTSLSLLSDLNQAYGLLREGLAVDRTELLKYVQSRFQDLTISADKTLQDAEARNPDPNRRNVTQAVLAFGIGSGNVFTLREREFGNRQSIINNLAAVTEAADNLNAEIEKHCPECANGGERCDALDHGDAVEQLRLVDADRRRQHPGGCGHRHLLRASEDRAEAATLVDRDERDCRGPSRHHIGDTGADEIGDVAEAVRMLREAGKEKIRLEQEAQAQQNAAAEERMRNEQARDAAAQQVEMVVTMLGTALSGVGQGRSAGAADRPVRAGIREGQG